MPLPGRGPGGQISYPNKILKHFNDIHQVLSKSDENCRRSSLSSEIFTNSNFANEVYGRGEIGKAHLIYKLILP